MMNYIQQQFSIQDNMEYLQFLQDNFSTPEKIVEQTRELIRWFGVQPDMETISFEDGDAMMIFWGRPGADYLSMYIYGEDTVDVVEYVCDTNEPKVFTATVDEAIDYYNTEWHERLFAEEFGAL